MMSRWRTLNTLRHTGEGQEEEQRVRGLWKMMSACVILYKKKKL